MLRYILLLLFVLHVTLVLAAPSHSMTRIQEVFRSLIPPSSDVRGKKYYTDPIWGIEDGGW